MDDNEAHNKLIADNIAAMCTKKDKCEVEAKKVKVTVCPAADSKDADCKKEQEITENTCKGEGCPEKSYFQQAKDAASAAPMVVGGGPTPA